MKRVISIVLTVCMLFTCAMTISAVTSSATDSGSFTVTTADSAIRDSGFAGTYQVLDSASTVLDSGAFEKSLRDGSATVSTEIDLEAGMKVKVRLTSPSGYEFSPSSRVVPANGEIAFAIVKSSGNNNGGGTTGGGNSGGGGGGGGGGRSSATAATVSATTAANSTTKAVDAAINAAINAGNRTTTAYVTFKNISTLNPAALKAINDAAAKASAGKSVAVTVRVNLDVVVNGKVVSRITIDPVAAAKLGGSINTGISVADTDRDVVAVTNKFNKYFSNEIVAFTYAEKAPIGMDVSVAAKLDFSKLDTNNLRVYSHNKVTNQYGEVAAPNIFVDTKGYIHMTVPMGGSVIITDRPLSN